MLRRLTNRHTSDTKVGQVCDRLNELARHYGPGGRLPTARELCVLFDTTKVTLNDALNAMEAQRILYRKPRSGIFVSPKLNHLHILVLLDSAYFTRMDLSPFWGHLWGKLAVEAQSRSQHRDVDFSFTLVTTRPGGPLPEGVTREVNDGYVDAAIAVGLGNEAADWLRSRLPVVAFACGGTSSVYLDNAVVVREGVRLLAEQGCRYPALISPWNHEISGAAPRSDREQIRDLFYALIQKRGWKGLDRHDRETVLAGDRHQEGGVAIARELFAPEFPTPPDSLIIMDDMLTIGVLAVLRERGLRPGKDVAIVTHANVSSPILFGYEKELERVAVDPQEIAQTMFGLMDELLAEEQPEAVTLIPLRHLPKGE